MINPELLNPRADAMWLRQLARFADGQNRVFKAEELNRIADAHQALERDRARLVAALRNSAEQIAHLQYLSGTDKQGELDALRDARVLLRSLGEDA